MNEKKSSKKGLILGIIAVAAIVAVLLGVWLTHRPAASTGTKAYTLVVVDDTGAEKSYTGKTDAEYLRRLMDELAATGDFSYEGTDSDYGIMLSTINGLTADYDTDGAYWAIYVNGDYGSYGADSQVVTDGDAFTLKYEVYAE